MRNVIVFSTLLALFSPALSSAQGGYSRRPRSGPATATSGPYSGPAVTFRGVVKALTKKEITLDLEGEEQTLTFRCSRKTKFFENDREVKPSEIAAGTHVTLEATREGDQKLAALEVIATPPAAKADRK